MNNIVDFAREPAPTETAPEVFERLEFDLAANFVRSVEQILRRLPDNQLNELYLMTITPAMMGDDVHVWTAVLAPVVEKEAELRRHISVAPMIGPVCAPELYRPGGGHHAPF